MAAKNPHKAMLLPEIISEILSWLSVKDWDFQVAEKEWVGSNSVLLQCSLVNRLWFTEAIPFLWRDPTDVPGTWNKWTLPSVFAAVSESPRRNIYASAVEKAVLNSVTAEDASWCDRALEGLRFPRLTSVQMFVDSLQRHIPRIGPNKVTELSFDPHCEIFPDINEPNPISYRVEEEDTEPLFEQIPERFPDLRKLEIADYCCAKRSVMERLTSRLPKLVEFDEDLVAIS